ncbi:MAG: hypothetical protein EOP10_02730 [Proteobacteria bacterium]|nr:MAG: hypothetical protein EOP10_02730 [Pseudomonadota bacterium]
MATLIILGWGCSSEFKIWFKATPKSKRLLEDLRFQEPKVRTPYAILLWQPTRLSRYVSRLCKDTECSVDCQEGGSERGVSEFTLSENNLYYGCVRPDKEGLPWSVTQVPLLYDSEMPELLAVDQHILSETSVEVAATASDFSKLSYSWEQVYGPNQITINDETAATIIVDGLSFGSYGLKLVVSDELGNSVEDEVEISWSPDP